MKMIIKRLLGAFAVGAVGSAAATAGADAKTFAELRAEEQAACEEALRINTIEALEAYLAKYPFGISACRALALNALGGFAPGGPQGGPPNTDAGNKENPGGYGG
jgi:hypothetical protein